MNPFPIGPFEQIFFTAVAVVAVLAEAYVLLARRRWRTVAAIPLLALGTSLLYIGGRATFWSVSEVVIIGPERWGSALMLFLWLGVPPLLFGILVVWMAWLLLRPASRNSGNLTAGNGQGA